MNNESYELSINEFRLKLQGTSCEECRLVCQAMCCKYPWSVVLNHNEFLTGQFDASQLCVLSNKECENPELPCEFRNYQVKKNKDGSCIYLDKDNRCGIYENRPLVCRETICSYTFKLSPVMQRKSHDTSKSSQNLKLLTDTTEISEVLIPHPLIRLVTVVYNKKMSSLIFVKERIGNCGKFYTKVDFNYPQLNEDQIIQLIRLFDRKEKLSQLIKEFQKSTAALLSESEFLEIVGLLLNHNIVLKAKNLFYINNALM